MLIEISNLDLVKDMADVVKYVKGCLSQENSHLHRLSYISLTGIVSSVFPEKLVMTGNEV